jgi:hypothetical protein
MFLHFSLETGIRSRIAGKHDNKLTHAFSAVDIYKYANKSLFLTEDIIMWNGSTKQARQK